MSSTPTISEQEKIIDALEKLALLLGENVTAGRFALYPKTMAAYPVSEVLSVIDLAATSCKFFPKPAELIELITGGKGGGQAETVAWRTVIANMSRHGSYYSVRFPDGAIAAAIEGMGGWPELCAKGDKEFTLERVPAQFVALYNNAVRMEIHKSPAVVLGSVETENAARGLAVEDARYTRDAITMDEIQAAPVRREALAAEHRQAIEYHAQEPETHAERRQAAETRRLLDKLAAGMKMRKELGISLAEAMGAE